MAGPFIAFAQKTIDNIPEHGFWVIVSNINVKKQATVQFFNDGKLLIYEEEITGRKLKLNNKTRYCLKQGLDKALAGYNSNRLVVQNKKLGSRIAA